jgi:hypothetical protein
MVEEELDRLRAFGELEVAPLMKASWTTAISACSDRLPLRDQKRHIAALE